MAAHAKLSASGSARWLNCTGSVKAERSFKDSSSPAAEYGTCAHELADIVLSTGKDIDSFLGQTLSDAPSVKVDQEMIDNVQGYVNYVQSFGGEQFYEVRLDYSHLVPNGFGTSDAVVIVNNVLHVIDLKMGKGVIVDAENNTQGMLYALGAVEEYGYLYDFDKVVIHIYQPRVSNFSTWELSILDLTLFGEYVTKQAIEALSDDAPRTPGDKQCQWCKAKATCPALLKHAEKTISADFDNLDDLSDVGSLTPDKLSVILSNKKLIESWLKAVEEHISHTLLDGEEFPGFKLVAGRSLRKWANEDEAQEQLITLLDEQAFEKKLLTVAKAEKALGAKRKKKIENLIIKPEGKPTLAPESDKRPSINNCSDDFDLL